jgi:hypothetical protein
MTENPFSTQGWNRYSYVGNSPLNFTDPSGYCFLGCFWKPIFKAIGNFFKQSFAAIIQVAATALLCSGPTAPICAGVIAFGVTGVTSGDLGLALRAGATAFFTAAAMNAVGTATLGEGHPMPAFMSPAHVANMAGHALVGCASAVMGGGKCGPGALSGAAGSFAGPILKDLGFQRNLVAHAVVGGVVSTAAGGNFANGAITSAFGYLFNACANGACWVTDEERALAAQGKYKYWTTACEGGDSYACNAAGASQGTSGWGALALGRLVTFLKNNGVIPWGPALDRIRAELIQADVKALDDLGASASNPQQRVYEDIHRYHERIFAKNGAPGAWAGRWSPNDFCPDCRR